MQCSLVAIPKFASTNMLYGYAGMIAFARWERERFPDPNAATQFNATQSQFVSMTMSKRKRRKTAYGSSGESDELSDDDEDYDGPFSTAQPQATGEDCFDEGYM